jgi:alkylresorcinol/alkylpyrone synthase
LDIPKEGPQILGVVSGFPQYYYSQKELTQMLARIWEDKEIDPERLDKFHQNMKIQGRHLALPMAEYETLDGFGSANHAWIKISMELSEKILWQLFKQMGVEPEAIDEMVMTSVTGIAVPSIDARLMNRIPFSTDLKRVPLFGLGCLGGAAGLARAADYLRGNPEDLVVLLSVELCSLTLQREDISIANLVSSGLFGDGAAAVLLAGAEYPVNGYRRPIILANRSAWIPETEDLMGYEIRDSGFKMLLSARVNEVIQSNLRPAVEKFLAEQGLAIGDIGYWIVHPGGPKIMDTVEVSLELHPSCLQPSRESLARYGNVSSTSVLLILEEVMAHIQPAEGEYGLLMAMGPGFSAEMMLLKW